MLRLTVLLLACLYAAFAIWGTPLPANVEVTRSAPMNSLPDLVAPSRLDPAVAQPVGSTVPSGQIPEPAAVVKPVAPVSPAPETRVVTGDRVNLRSDASSRSAIVGSLSRGDTAEIMLDNGTSWVRIRTQAGLEAWIFARFLAEAPT